MRSRGYIKPPASQRATRPHEALTCQHDTSVGITPIQAQPRNTSSIAAERCAPGSDPASTPIANVANQFDSAAWAAAN